MTYLSWNEQTITDFSESNISDMYNRGYVFTRIGKGVMHQTRSVRIDLSKFGLTSENRRILKKTGNLDVTMNGLPLREYDWNLGKMAKDFYEKKFGPGIMSAQKAKEMLSDGALSSFNALLEYTLYDINQVKPEKEGSAPSSAGSLIGYAICHQNKNLLHYSYPFYDLEKSPADMGMGMMIRAIEYAMKAGLKHIYLGSLQRPGDTYKLQFQGLEWFDGKTWQTDLEEAKKALLSEVSPA